MSRLANIIQYFSRTFLVAAICAGGCIVYSQVDIYLPLQDCSNKSSFNLIVGDTNKLLVDYDTPPDSILFDLFSDGIKWDSRVVKENFGQLIIVPNKVGDLRIEAHLFYGNEKVSYSGDFKMSKFPDVLIKVVAYETEIGGHYFGLRVHDTATNDDLSDHFRICQINISFYDRRKKNLLFETFAIGPEFRFEDFDESINEQIIRSHFMQITAVKISDNRINRECWLKPDIIVKL